MKKKDIRLYNALFPIWFLHLFPNVAWPLILAGNFAIDSAVLLICAKLQWLDGKELWKKHIVPVWLIGFLSDFIGAALTFLIYTVLVPFPDVPNLYVFPWATLLALPGTAMAGVLIYVLNKHLTFRKSDLYDYDIRRLCLCLAVFTAPYTMLISYL